MKYLVVYDAGSGYAEICNVAVVQAETKQDAKNEALKIWGFSQNNKDRVWARDIEEIPIPWSFYR